MRKKNITTSVAGLLILFAFFFMPRHWKTILSILCIVLVCYLLVKLILIIKERKHVKNPINTTENSITEEQQQTNYLLKKSLITDSEKPYLDAIKKLVEPTYIVQAQINLASIIDKKSSDSFRNELFRNIDFGIFDNNYKPLVLIEINDQSHTTASRKKRDQKVKEICANAKIPLIVLWTNFGVNENYIKKRLSEHIALNDNNSENENNQKNILQNTQGES